MNWFLSIVIIVAIFSLIYWALREHRIAETLRKEVKSLREKKSELEDERAKLSDSVRQKGTDLVSMQNKAKRLQKELDKK